MTLEASRHCVGECQVSCGLSIYTGVNGLLGVVVVSGMSLSVSPTRHTAADLTVSISQSEHAVNTL